MRLKVEALGGLAALGEARAFGEMVRYARNSGDSWIEAFMSMMIAQAHLRRGQPFAIPTLAGVEDPFLLALAENFPWHSHSWGLLERYPFLLGDTLFAPPAHRSRRLLWEAGKLDLPYHPGVCVEIHARGRLRVWVGQQEARFRREKARILQEEVTTITARVIDLREEGMAVLEALATAKREVRNGRDDTNGQDDEDQNQDARDNNDSHNDSKENNQ